MRSVKSVLSYSSFEFQEAVKSSTSIAGVARFLGFNGNSGVVRTIKKRILTENVDTTHFLPSHTYITRLNKKPIESLLVENGKTKSSDLKKRILKEGLLENKCYECGLLPEWNNKILILQLDHINGINNDNRLENLRILCPNCHTQTDTYGGKKLSVIYTCSECGSSITKYGKLGLCCTCANKKTHPTKFLISKEVLEKLVWEKPTQQIAKDFGVSDKAIEKRCKKLGISKPTRGYWQKRIATTK